MSAVPAREPWTRGRDVVLVAACFAVLAALIQTGMDGFRMSVLRKMVWLNPDFALLMPLAFLLWFLPFALAIALICRATRRGLPVTASVTAFAGLAVFALLIPFTQIAMWASAILATGIGFQAGRVAAANPDRWLRRLRAGACVAAGLLAAAGIGVRANRAWAERSAIASLPAARTGAPNVLLIVLDTVRATSLGLYGHDRPTTPNLDRWASQGVVFDRAISTAPWTLPSHASLFTGRPAGRLTADFRTPLSAEARTLAEALRDHGYATAGIVANVPYASSETGLARGFAHYEDYRWSLPMVLLHCPIGRMNVFVRLVEARSLGAVRKAFSPLRLSPTRLPADAASRNAVSITSAFLRWQDTVRGRPFFAFLNYFDAHAPYRAPPQYTSRFARTPAQPDDRYDATIAFQDDSLDVLFETLKRRGVLDDTIVIVTSDHGDQFGEHNLDGHSNSLYLPLLHVPLVLRHPASAPAGLRVSATVTLRDVAATILDLAGISEGGGIQGASLARYWRSSDPPAASDVIAELNRGVNVVPEFGNSEGPMVCRLDQRFHYIRNGTGVEELYDYRDDPDELSDLSGRPDMKADLERLKRGLGPTYGEISLDGR
jgi:arylsulfatase A-like enzyme